MTGPEDYALQRLRDALASDERVAEMGVHVDLVAGKVFLSGQVATVERREAVGGLAREMLPAYEIHNETVVTDMADRPRVEKITTAGHGDRPGTRSPDEPRGEAER